jgi:tRNA-dihydrouridine synthase
MEHLELAVEHGGERYGLVSMRRHYAGYFRGMRGAAQLRAELNGFRQLEPLREWLLALGDAELTPPAEERGTHSSPAVA